MNPDLTIVAISNREPTEKNCYAEFLASARKYGYEPVIIGGDHYIQDGKFPANPEYGGLGTRPRILKRAIEQGKAPTKYMLFSDAWDVVFARDPGECVDYIISHSCDIVWNAEKNCFPDGWRAGQHPDTSSPYKYLNSGFAIGTTDSFLTALRDMHADEITDDYTNIDGVRIQPCCQAYWMREYIMSVMGLTRVSIGIDRECRIAQTMHLVTGDELEFIDGGWIRNKEFGFQPTAYHFNGSARDQPTYEKILKHLGYRN